MYTKVCYNENMPYAAKIREKDGQMWVKLPPLLVAEIKKTSVRVVVIRRVGENLPVHKPRRKV